MVGHIRIIVITVIVFNSIHIPFFTRILSLNIAFHYYIQQSIRNILRRLVHEQNRFDAIKRILQNNGLLPPQKDVMRLYLIDLRTKYNLF